MLSKSKLAYTNYKGKKLNSFSFVSETLRTVGRDMKSKDMDEDDVEEHVSCLSFADGQQLISR